MSRLVSLLYLLAGAGGILIACLYAATFYAIDKSRERVECYRRTQDVSACPVPDVIERAMRTITERKDHP